MTKEKLLSKLQELINETHTTNIKWFNFVFFGIKTGKNGNNKRKNTLRIHLCHLISPYIDGVFSFTYHFLFILDSSLYLEDERKRGFVSSGYKADDEASDDGELSCIKGV